MFGLLIRFCLVMSFKFLKYPVIRKNRSCFAEKRKIISLKTNSDKEIFHEKTAGLFCIINGCFILGA